MSEFVITQAVALVQLSATAAYADSGPDNSTISIHAGDGTPLAIVTLAKPCATFTETGMRLVQQDAGGDLIMETGIAAYGVWVNGDGLQIATGSVTDDTGAGPFILGGANATQLYAGGRVILGETELT